MKIVAIWSWDRRTRTIGVNGEIPWHFSSDLKRFKQVTEGGIIIVGQNTYESFPERTLPNRKIIVLSDKQNYEVSDSDNHYAISYLDHLDIIRSGYDIGAPFSPIETLYVCGGAQVYKLFLSSEKYKPDYCMVSNVPESGLAYENATEIDIDTSLILWSDYVSIYSDTPDDGIENVVFAKKDNVCKHLMIAASHRHNKAK